MRVFLQKHQGGLILILLALLLQARGIQGNKDQIRAGLPSFDYDGYWHLLRVQEIHRTGSWDNEINPRGNAPFGERLHWTHAMDLVLWTGATIGSVFTDFDSSLYWWGVFVGPAFYVVSLTLLVWLGHTLLGPRYGRLPALLFLGSVYPLLTVYSVNRPDHHCLVAFAFVVYYSLFLVLLENPRSAPAALGVGLAGAFGLWCGLEILILVGLSVLYLGLLWLIQGEKYLKANGLLTLALSVGLTIAALSEGRPNHYWDIAYDKVSVVHAGLLSLAFMFWLGEGLLGRIGLGRTAVSRLALAAGGALPMLLAGWVLFPQFLRGPLTRVDPRLHALYLDRTTEFGAMTSVNLPHVAYTVLLAGPAFLYLLWAAYRNHEARRTLFTWLAVTLCVYFILALTMGRWVYTLAFTSILPAALLLAALWKWGRAGRKPLVAFAVTLMLVFVPYLALIALGSSHRAGARTERSYKSKLVALLSFLTSQPDAAPGQILLANICVGPAIMYYTALDAVGTPNHSNAQGIMDTYNILNAGDDEAARRLIQARGIAYLLIDEPLKRFAAYPIDSPRVRGDSCAETTFVDRLSIGQIPDWLIRMPVPEELASTFMLFRVEGGDVEVK